MAMEPGNEVLKSPIPQHLRQIIIEKVSTKSKKSNNTY